MNITFVGWAGLSTFGIPLCLITIISAVHFIFGGLTILYFKQDDGFRQYFKEEDGSLPMYIYQEEFALEDVTDLARQAIHAIRDICGDVRDTSWNKNFTISHIVDVLKGSTVKKVLNSGHDKHKIYGMAKSWQRSDLERLLHKLTLECYLEETHIATRDGIVNTYTKIGKRAFNLLSGNAKIELPMRQKAKKGVACVVTASVEEEEEDSELKEIQDSCYSALKEKVRDMALELGVNSNVIMNTEALRSMAKSLPETEEDMLKVVGVTKANFVKYGKPLLDIIQGYVAQKIVVLHERDMLKGSKVDENKDAECIELLDPEWLSSRTESLYFGGRTTTGRGGYRGKRKASFRAKGRAAKKTRVSRSRNRSGSGSTAGSPKKYRKRGGNANAAGTSGKSIPKVLPSDRVFPPNKRSFIPLPKVSLL